MVRGWLEDERPRAMLHYGSVGAGADLRSAGDAHAHGARGLRGRMWENSAARWTLPGAATMRSDVAADLLKGCSEGFTAGLDR